MIYSTRINYPYTIQNKCRVWRNKLIDDMIGDLISFSDIPAMISPFWIIHNPIAMRFGVAKLAIMITCLVKMTLSCQCSNIGFVSENFFSSAMVTNSWRNSIKVCGLREQRRCKRWAMDLIWSLVPKFDSKVFFGSMKVGWTTTSIFGGPPQRALCGSMEGD